MGDDELNFTEEEARCWADDPRNQPANDSTKLIFLSLCILLLFALIGLATAGDSRPLQPERGAVHVGSAPAGATQLP